MKNRFALVLLLTAPVFAGAFFSCSALDLGSLAPDPRPGNRVTVATWNLQNLFDEVDDGDEYPEFDPGRGWTRAQFWGRCASLATVVRSLADGGPDLLVVEEVEGAHALEVFHTRFLPDLGYRYRFLAPAQTRGVKTAVLSRYPFVRTGLLYPAGTGDEVQRPLVEVEVSLGDRSLVVVANHWKSRIPTPQATEALRLQSARTLRQRLAALETRPDRPFVVAVGDFNTSVELSRPWDDQALVSGGAYGEEDTGLAVYPTRTGASVSILAGAVWDPWETVAEPRGSYLYQGTWNRLDHAFVGVTSLGLPDWAFGSFQVGAYAAEPQPYGPRTPNGVSDHFPLVLTLVRR